MTVVFEIDELLQIIFQFMCSLGGAPSYKNINLVCWRWYNLNDRSLRNKLMNHLWTLINKFPQRNWDWWHISLNPNTNLNLIKYWDINDENWNWYNITYNPAINWSEMLTDGLPEGVPDNYSIYANPNINLDTILEGFKKQRNVVELSNFAMIISRNPNVTPDFLVKNMLPWNDEILSKNPNITWDFIEAAPNANWNWLLLSSNPAIDWDIISQSETKPWDLKLLTGNPSITWDIIHDKIIPKLESQGELVGEGVWDIISENPNITMEFINSHSKYGWHACGISRNPNLVADMVIANPAKYCFKCLSRNLFNKYEKKYSMLFY